MLAGGECRTGAEVGRMLRPLQEVGRLGLRATEFRPFQLASPKHKLARLGKTSPASPPPLIYVKVLTHHWAATWASDLPHTAAVAECRRDIQRQMFLTRLLHPVVSQ